MRYGGGGGVGGWGVGGGNSKTLHSFFSCRSNVLHWQVFD